MKNETKGMILVLSSGFSWSFAGIITKALFNAGTTPIPIILTRNTCGVILLGLLILLYNKRMFHIDKEDIPMLLACCLVLFIYSAAYFFAIYFIDVSIAVVLLYMYPVMVAGASVFLFKDRLTLKVILALCMMIFGMMLTADFIGSGMERVSPIGLILGIFAAVGAAGYCICGKKLTAKYHSFTINFYGILFTVFGYLAVSPFMNNEPLTSGQFTTSLLAAVPYIGGFVLYTAGVKYVRPSFAGIFGTSEAVFSVLLAAIILGEVITASHFAGMLLILGAIALIETPGRKKKKSPPQQTLS